MKIKWIIIEAISFLYILLFLYAAFSKITEYDKFLVQLGQSPMITLFAKFIAVIIPAVEIIIAVLLSIPKTKLLGLYASYTLMMLFTCYIVAITGFSDYVPCSCGGILSMMGWTEHLIFNIGFVALGIVSVLLFPRVKVDPERDSYSTADARYSTEGT